MFLQEHCSQQIVHNNALTVGMGVYRQAKWKQTDRRSKGLQPILAGPWCENAIKNPLSRFLYNIQKQPGTDTLYSCGDLML